MKNLPEVNQLPHVTQTPIIAYEMLAVIGDKVKTEIAKLNIESIEATEENLSNIKNLRSSLSNEFKALDERRKFIKSSILKPYDDFETNYKKLITVEFENAETLLKSKVTLVESGILTRKTDGLKEYFGKKNTFDFIKFEDLGLKIIKSASDKSIQTEIDKKLEQITSDLSVIETLEHKNRVLARYQLTKDLNGAISSVNIEIQKEKENQAAAAKIEHGPEIVAKEKQPAVIETPVIEEPKQAVPVDNKKYKMNFSVVGTKEQLKAVKEFMDLKGIEYV